MIFDIFQLSSSSCCICFRFGKLVPRLAARLTVAGLILNFRATSAQLIIILGLQERCFVVDLRVQFWYLFIMPRQAGIDVIDARKSYADYVSKEYEQNIA